MELFLRIDINIVAMILLGLVYFIANRRLDKDDRLNKKFFETSLIIIIEIGIETLTCIINGRPEAFLRPLSNLLHVALFITAPVIAYIWIKFVYSIIKRADTVPLKNRIVFIIPIAINTIMTLASPFFGFVFSISETNIYQRGPLFYVPMLITYLYILFSFIMLTLNRKKIMRQEYIAMHIFCFFSILGGIVQTLFYGTLLMWSSCAFSLMIVYVFLQQRMIQLDTLTGAWTRSSFDYYITQKFLHKSQNNFGAIFVDLDGLKKINDNFGHGEGDIAIKTTVQLLKGSLRKTDVVARMGGDEFIIVIDCESYDDLQNTVNRISASFQKYNHDSGKTYKLGYSYGADMFHMNYKNVEQMLHHIDILMYDNKKKKAVCI
ncbi:MAG: diguanylate cyclase domain-containing protein [Christensenellales bacterium]